MLRQFQSRSLKERDHAVAFNRVQVGNLGAQQTDERLHRFAGSALTHQVRRLVGVDNLVEDVEQFLFDLFRSVESHDLIGEFVDVDFHGKLDEASPIEDRKSVV